MFIFTVFFNLLMLPFTLLRMAFSLLGISSRLLLFPLRIIARHTIACIIIAVVLVLYFAIKKDPHAVDTLKPAPKTHQTSKKQPDGAPPIIEAVTRREDGDSAFATDTYAIMNDAERNYYSSIFYKTMSTIADNQQQDWDYYNIRGALRPNRTFKNNVGVVCRTFSERLKVHHVEQTITGTACAQPGGTWCKLKPNATPACGLGHSPGAFDGITNAVRNLF